ncbi:FKBP-type peptidyl-prolyl cis-trans isomerase [Spirosoma areae]
MGKFHYFILGALIISGLTSCKTDIVDPGNNATQANQDDIRSYAASKGLSGTATSTGLYYVPTKPGLATAATPAYGQELEFSYKLYVLLGPSNSSNTTVTDKLVDTTYATKSTFYPFFPGSLKPGLEEGILRMREGEQATLLMPSNLAFGDQATTDNVIPANSPVRFDVALKRARTEDQQINEYLTANKLTPTELTTSGLRFIKTVNNTLGASPTATQTLIVKYNGRLLRSASAFDSTGTGTYPTTIGKSIPGFDEGLAKLKVGEKATLIIPSKIGYGVAGSARNGVYVIPPYSPMRFDIELVSVQ